MCAVLDGWAERDVDSVSVQHIDTVIGNRLGSFDQRGHAPTCGRWPAAMETGDVYECDHFVEPSYHLGRVGDDDLADLVDSDPACPVRWACHEGCKKDGFVPSSAGEPGHDYLCAGYRAFFEPAAPLAEMVEHAASRGASVSARDAADAVRPTATQSG